MSPAGDVHRGHQMVAFESLDLGERVEDPALAKADEGGGIAADAPVLQGVLGQMPAVRQFLGREVGDGRFSHGMVLEWGQRAPGDHRVGSVRGAGGILVGHSLLSSEGG